MTRQPSEMFMTGTPMVIPTCDAIEPYSLHIGGSCLSDCDGFCNIRAAHGGLRLVPDFEQEAFRQGCSKGQRYICSIASENPAGYPLCEELDKNTCGEGCSCWSTCTEHRCNLNAIVPGLTWSKDANTITPSGCLLDLERHLCTASGTGAGYNFDCLIFSLLCLLLLGLIYIAYRYFSRKS